jgi:FixJ family two-component response regulator
MPWFLVPDHMTTSGTTIESCYGQWPGITSAGIADLCALREAAQMAVPFIAVVDDDEALCSSLVDLMRAIGYRAAPFYSAEAFLGSVDRFDLDCIIADIHMPGMGGLNLLRVAREQGIATPVVLITALTDRKLDAEAAALGALCLLRKPFETSSLLDHIERSVRK